MPGQSFRGFSEKVAVVTNGAQGIGRAVALQLALQGSYVIVSHTEETEENIRAMQSLRDIGTLAYSVETNVSKLEGIKTLFSSVEEMYGRLDLLVNCAAVAVNEETALDQLTEEAWQHVIDNNLKSVLFCTQAAVNLMNGRPSPAIVNVAYECEDFTSNKSAQFVASQAGLIGLTRALSNELKPRRIRVNCVAIGPSLIEGKKDGPAFSSSPFDDAARAIVYLLSSEAKAVSGQTIKVGSIL